MNKHFLAFSLLAVSFATTAKGVGYGNTEWGMTPSQVVAAQKGNAHIIAPEKYKDSWGKVRTDNVNIGSGLYTVSYLFDSSDRLIQANVASNEKSNVGIIQNQFDALHQLLTQKYGKPQFEGSDKVTWKTADTTIELSKMIIQDILAQNVVRYVPNGKVNSDTSNL